MPREIPPTSLTDRTAPPGHDAAHTDPVSLDHTFGFVDVSGFTSFCEIEGEHAATEVLTHFRLLTRSIAVRRGVRVAKWLGDGVMLVAADQGPVVATVGELVARCSAMGLPTHAGLARGPVLLFEGDDYIGRAVNLAARLCDAAVENEMLSSGLSGALPDWIVPHAGESLALAGMGVQGGVIRLEVVSEVRARFAAEPVVVV